MKFEFEMKSWIQSLSEGNWSLVSSEYTEVVLERVKLSIFDKVLYTIALLMSRTVIKKADW